MPVPPVSVLFPLALKTTFPLLPATVTGTELTCAMSWFRLRVVPLAKANWLMAPFRPPSRVSCPPPLDWINNAGLPSLPKVALTVRSAGLMPAPKRKVSPAWVFCNSTLPNPASNS